MSIATLDKRLKEIEKCEVYHVRTLADVVLLSAWRARDDPRMPDEGSIVWSPEMEQLADSLKSHKMGKTPAGDDTK